ncbi:MAG: thioredoxin-like domain-containing protein [Gammaproteobacteria bacterium]|nr:MAG: thioredoxin-like domain-containing protein [Gammaproteobacteria bacterium]
MSETRIRAPELPDHLEWFNTESPVKIAEQKGKVVLLDFWTYCCINCIHVLPDLAYLEKKFPDGLTIIGVHSPKHPGEKIGANVQKAINRHYIKHPVAHDPEFKVWQQYGIKAWPSIIFIDPEGYVLGVLRGEGRRAQLEKMIADSLEKAERTGIRQEKVLKTSSNPEQHSYLRFPGKILSSGKNIYISDTTNNRVIEAMPNGRVISVYGTGTATLVDGSYKEAAFCEPQGLTLRESKLYVADTGNHAVREINLVSREVSTISGNGQQARLPTSSYDNPREALLNSPWDITHFEGKLYIAMAGPHQIWSLDLNMTSLMVYTGTGRESIDDGSVRTATFAQPSGLTVGEYLGHNLYVADSETSAIRCIRLRDGHVTTLIGSGLFDFGDKDGPAKDARLQHPLGVYFDAKRTVLWIADTFNNKIKTLNLVNNEVRTIPIGVPLHEPGGLSIDDKYLWIANTNAHEIVRLDLSSGESEVVEIFEVESSGL